MRTRLVAVAIIAAAIIPTTGCWQIAPNIWQEDKPVAGWYDEPSAIDQLCWLSPHDCDLFGWHEPICDHTRIIRTFWFYAEPLARMYWVRQDWVEQWTCFSHTWSEYYQNDIDNGWFPWGHVPLLGLAVTTAPPSIARPTATLAIAA